MTVTGGPTGAAVAVGAWGCPSEMTVTGTAEGACGCPSEMTVTGAALEAWGCPSVIWETCAAATVARAKRAKFLLNILNLFSKIKSFIDRVSIW